MHIIYEYTLQVFLLGRLCVPACKLYMCAWTIHCIWLLNHNVLVLVAHLRGVGGELVTACRNYLHGKMCESKKLMNVLIVLICSIYLHGVYCKLSCVGFLQ